MQWETSPQQLQNRQYLGVPGKRKRVYVEFLYNLTIIGFYETGAEATELHTSSCDKNSDKLW